jgi:ATP-dependent exoDNAse (exonuclease V) beta subunit
MTAERPAPVVFGPAAEALFRLDAPTAVSAGAGSGKTTALVELCLRLLDGAATGAPCAPAELAAITFTEKAAEELAGRLRAAVAARAREAAEGAAAGTPGAAERGEAWRERLAGLDRMAVGTIHGFCARLLREHAPEAGLDPELEVVEEDRAAGWLLAGARAAVVAALDAGRPAARALAAGLGAGARGGLPALVAGLVRERATRGARGEPATAAADPAGAEALGAEVLRAAAALVACRGEAASPEAAAMVEAVARAREVADAAGASLGPGALARLGALGEAARARLRKGDGAGLRAAQQTLRDAAEAFGAAAADALGWPQRRELAALVAEAERRYAARKREARAVDFDDLLALARDLLRRDPALLAELRGRLRALLVDEYQDVNPVQQELFELLCAPGDPGAPPGPRLVAVGDLKQSIYRFRGADVAVFAALITRFEAGAGRVLHLSENHRSAPAVLELVNAVSAGALQPPAGEAPRPFEIAFGPGDRLVPRRPEGARPACDLLVERVDDAEEGGDGDAGRARRPGAAQRRLREARAVAARIRAVVSGAAGVLVRERGAPGEPERSRPPRLGEVAVLFRRLTQLGPYERALREAGIPYRLARGGGFYQASEVRDLGELLASLDDPDDVLAWAALLRSPACAVTDGALVLLARVGLGRLHALAGEALAAALAAAAAPGGDPGAALAPEERARLERFLDAWRALHEAQGRVPLGALCRSAVEALDLDAALLAAPGGERRAENLKKALALAARFGERGGTPGELAAFLRQQAARPPREPEAELEAADAVALLSVHQAKGLEWPVVFVPDLGARPPPDGRRALLDAAGLLCASTYDPERELFVDTPALRAARELERRAQAAEGRRLLYVALTRARDHLVLSGEAGTVKECWRRHVDAALAAEPGLVRRVPVDQVLAEAAAPPAGVEAAREAPPAPPRLVAPATALPAVRLAVTEVVEYARCPRRHLLGRVLGLPEPAGAQAAPADDPSRATARGTLAHAMLAEADLAAPPLERRAQLAAAAARRGYAPEGLGVRRILAEVLRFLDSPGGRELAAAGRDGRLRREVPFLLRLGEPPPAHPAPAERGRPSVYLTGALDALVEAGHTRRRGERAGAAAGARGRELTVIDFKYATARPGAAERYRLQLTAYALAAARAHPGVRVRARLQFLRGDHRALELTPSPAELARFEALVPQLARELGAGVEPSPAQLGRTEERCRAEGCGYVGRCYGRRGEPRLPP